MATSPNTLKGNPASKRMQNAALKTRRARSWAAGQRRKHERKIEAASRARANDELRRMNIPTAWEEAKAARTLRRQG